ncbi:MAG: ribonuclease P protein component [Atopobiaceae bacterium]|jgi:ribonuclease P protein component|nr:ribonuclease P protein component [Atopobiaceae bacterium]MCI2173660.1 ribonuclease P protein component [Atopobiaceae bacterium]MCI2207698.1 ribonuclease P protein component [Atopobiaceae bacterium]
MKTIKSKREFETVFSTGRKSAGRFSRVIVCGNTEGGPGKVAFVAAKRLGNAVYRNRCKRVLRVAARESGLPIDGKDVIILANGRTHGASPAEVADDLVCVIEKATR